MSTPISPNSTPNFSRPLSANAAASTSQSTRSSAATLFTPADSAQPQSSIHETLDAAPPPTKTATRQSKPMGLGIGRPSASADSEATQGSKEKPVARGGGFGAPGTGTAARASRKRSRVEVAAPEEPLEAAGRLVPNQDEKAGFDNAVEFDPDNDDDDDDDDEGGGKKARTASGAANARRKIQISYIEDKARRHITFSKRKAGIMKKAFELSTLTGTQVLLLVVSETGLVYTFTTTKLQPLVTRDEGKNLIQACLNAPDGEGPDGGPAGPGGMTTGARSKSAGGPGSTIRHKDDITSNNGYDSNMPSPTSPYGDIPIPPIPVPLPTVGAGNTARRPSAALPKRGRQPSMAAAKAKAGRGAADKAGPSSDNSDEQIDQLAHLERIRQRGMNFHVDEDDDDDLTPANARATAQRPTSAGGLSAAELYKDQMDRQRNMAQRLHAHSMAHSDSSLGGIQQYDDYSTQSVDVGSKLEDQEDDSMHSYLSVGAASGIPAHLNQQHHQQQHQSMMHLQQQQQQQQQQQHHQQMGYQQQYGHLQPHQYPGGAGGFSPGHQTLSPTPSTPFEPGQYVSGQLAGTW